MADYVIMSSGGLDGDAQVIMRIAYGSATHYDGATWGNDKDGGGECFIEIAGDTVNSNIANRQALIKEPDSYSVGHEDIDKDSTKRGSDGKMKRAAVRTGKKCVHTISVSFSELTQDEIYYLMSYTDHANILIAYKDPLVFGENQVPANSGGLMYGHFFRNTGCETKLVKLKNDKESTWSVDMSFTEY